jgi:hypothetical protein
VCISQGVSFDLDLIQSAKYFKLAADQNDSDAQFNYGLCLRDGDGVPVDLIQSAKYLKLAADQNLAEAQFNYGLCLRDGDGVPIDLVQSAEYFKLAADQNDDEAQIHYGWCLERGLGVGQNLPECARLYGESMIQQNRIGAAHYALCLHYGIGVVDDLDAASDHYEFSLPERPTVLVQNAHRCLQRLNRRRVAEPRPQQTIDAPQSASSSSGPPGRFDMTPVISSYRIRRIGQNGDAEIGRGGFGITTLHHDPETGKRTAVKHIAVAHSREKLLAEVVSLLKMNDPCVIRIIGWSDGGQSQRGEIHMEFASNGSLDDLLGRARRGYQTVLGRLTEKAKLICGIVLGMRYVHSKGIIHRDLKPSNIMFDEHWRPKIIDFGMSRPESSPGSSAADTGTIWYSAPEQLVVGGRHTRKIDVFSFGYILYEILTGNAVFAPSEPERHVQKRIRRGELPVLPHQSGTLMQGLIRRCWSVDPTSRPSFEGIFREFEECGFAILPDADPEVIKQYVNGILALESRAAHR